MIQELLTSWQQGLVQTNSMSEIRRKHSDFTGELLRTKLAPPRLHSAPVPRPSLLARLDGGLECKLILISAPAGFGKSTLVAGSVQGSGIRPHPTARPPGRTGGGDQGSRNWFARFPDPRSPES